MNRIIPRLVKGEEIQKSIDEKILTGDYVVDEKHKTITVTDEGWEKVEGLLSIGNIADPENWGWKHHVETAIKAHNLYRRDVEYVVKDGEVIIVDEFTGRMMPGRRWSDGLHQAVEAKENVKIERENQTLATISFQNYFRMYNKLAGMTGTAETEAAEFSKIYNLDIVVIPTNRPMRRIENADIVYRTAKAAYDKARSGGGPSLIECLTYRYSGHSRADPAKYRPEGELDFWRGKRDPVKIYRDRLIAAGIPESTLREIEDVVRQRVDEATAICKAAPPPPADILTTDVYADGGWAWRN